MLCVRATGYKGFSRAKNHTEKDGKDWLKLIKVFVDNLKMPEMYKNLPMC